MGCFFSGMKGTRRGEWAGPWLKWTMDERRWEALRQPASKALSRGGGAEAQGAPELALDTRVFPEPEDCVSPPRAV